MPYLTRIRTQKTLYIQLPGNPGQYSSNRTKSFYFVNYIYCTLQFINLFWFNLKNGGAKDGLDMNIAPAWQKGYTGKGVVVSILDDGIQTNHPDLAQNYVRN